MYSKSGRSILLCLLTIESGVAMSSLPNVTALLTLENSIIGLCELFKRSVLPVVFNNLTMQIVEIKLPGTVLCRRRNQTTIPGIPLVLLLPNEKKSSSEMKTEVR